MHERNTPVLHDSGVEELRGGTVYRIYTVDEADLIAVISARSQEEAEAILAAICDQDLG